MTLAEGAPAACAVVRVKLARRMARASRGQRNIEELLN
jgi:hypothetical protein